LLSLSAVLNFLLKRNELQTAKKLSRSFELKRKPLAKHTRKCTDSTSLVSLVRKKKENNLLKRRDLLILLPVFPQPPQELKPKTKKKMKRKKRKSKGRG